MWKNIFGKKAAPVVGYYAPIKKGPEGVRLAFINAGVLLPAVVFWESVVMYVTLKTDYMYDVVFAKMGQHWTGNLILAVMIVILPAGTILGNILIERIKPQKVTKIYILIAAVFLIAGVAALVKKP